MDACNLTKFKRLFLKDNDISDIHAPLNLANLQYLDLANNNISDISPLSNLVNLELLDLANNNISDISPLCTIVLVICVTFTLLQISLLPIEHQCIHIWFYT
ncbi:MAG: leucine-rich repeat domain-containing protein [Theionarchaea archaeon]|nr:leucine-rich repeat domain-containing protein [Theionarchaea archaeon]